MRGLLAFSINQSLQYITIQKYNLWLLQTRIGKRTGVAAIRMAIEMLESGMIDEKTAIMRVKTGQLDEIMHPTLDADVEKDIPIKKVKMRLATILINLLHNS